MATITVLGAGMMGSALCVPLCDRGHQVRLVGTRLDDEIIAALQARQPHPTLHCRLPDGVQPFGFSELEIAMADTEMIALGVSSAGLRWAAQEVARFAERDRPVVMITKGLDWDGQTLSVFPDIVAAALPPALRSAVFPAAIAGPCIAGELARRVPSCVVLTGRHAPTLERIARVLRSDSYHVWTSPDVVGVEICAALKNAYAMGVALAAGIHTAAGGTAGSVAMHNIEAAVFAQAAWEMRRVVVALGGDGDSVLGLAGVGDLDVTNNGGRTGRFGALLGRGLSRDQAIERMPGATLECLEILEIMDQAVRVLERQGKLASRELPLLTHLVAILHGEPVDLPYTRFFTPSRVP